MFAIFTCPIFGTKTHFANHTLRSALKLTFQLNAFGSTLKLGFTLLLLFDFFFEKEPQRGRSSHSHSCELEPTRDS